jgi:transposase InsO family protein
MDRIYYAPKAVGSYGGVEPLTRALGDSKPKDVLEWLRSQSTYTLHKPVRKNFLRNRVIVEGIDDQWQADLVDMQAYSRSNNGTKYLLTCIDVFSKYAWAIPLKNKTGPEVMKAIQLMFKDGRKPYNFNTDRGKEFENKHVRGLFKKHDIHFFTTRSDLKASVVERFNRTLKSKMWRYFTHKGHNKYIDILKDLMTSYNNSRHRSIGMAPNQVDIRNQAQVKEKLYGNINISSRKYMFSVGDTVRISKQKMVFDKGYLPNWTEELFTISERIPRFPPVYRIKDHDGEVLEGTFYEQELQKVIKTDDVYVIEKILRKAKKGGVMHALVKWRGFPQTMNSWVPVSELIRV